jgi:hypothetical protein
MRIRALAAQSLLVLAFVLVALPADAQSCAAADAALGPSKSKGQLKAHFDKFADSTTLESNDQGYAFMGQGEIMKVSLVAKHAGQAASAMTAALHLHGIHDIGGRVKAGDTPDRFSDSSSAIVVADTSRFVLRGGGHHTTHNELNLIGPPTVDEDVYFPISPEQLLALAHTKDGGIRIGEFDMPMKGRISESADAVYRAVTCSLTTPAAGTQ